MASRHKEPLRWRNSDTSLLSPYLIALLLVFLVCSVFKVDDDVIDQDLLVHCRSTCNEQHIKAAAMNHPYPSLLFSADSGSLSPTIDTLFLHRKLGVEQSATFRRNDITSNPVAPKPASQVRPRRLPTLIKVLTGYDDEPYWNVPRSTDRLGRTHVPVIAHIEKPKIEPSQHKRKRRIKSDDTVQIAAAAAATALWSQSIHSFGSCRMNRVNSEWDAALRWIAGWDSTVLSEDTSLNEWANNLVDDLTTALEACIEQCSEGQIFDHTHYTDEDDVDSFGAVDIDSFSIGAFIWRSVFGWSFGSLLRLSELGRLDTTTQIVASTFVVYVIHSFWGSGLDWFRRLRDRDTSDDWLIQYEKEMETAKSSRTRQKKGKKSKKKQKQWSGSKRGLVDKKATKNEALASTSQYVGTALARDDGNSNVPDDDFVPGDPHDQQSDLVCSDAKRKIVVSKDSIGSSMHDGVPSIISLSSATSVTSSPSMKPRSPSPTNVPENQPLTNHAFTTSVARGGVYSQQLQGRNAFAVPTVEQRNEAANQLRDFQNAQIRRLVLQKQQQQQQQQQQNVAQDGMLNQQAGVGSSPALNVPLGAGNVSKKTKKELKPPPGFSEFTPNRQDQYPSNLDENELLLSKLLDDDEDEVNGKDATLPVSIESSLDPSAAPFFISDVGHKCNRLEPKQNNSESDQWAGKIKGVYGGSVW